MNPVTLRRLLVFGVCAVGVGALYVTPGLTGRSGQVATPAGEDEATRLPSGTSHRTVTANTRSASLSASRSAAPSTPATSGDPRPVSPTGTAAGAQPAPRPVRTPSTGATAYDPRRGSDHVAPDRVADVTTSDVTADRLTVRWPAVSDDVGVLRYRVVLNGFTVATTSQTHATVRWFNDDVQAHVIQVRALDAAGNESPSSPNLLVSRPSPSATPGPSSTATSPQPSPTPSASRSASPSPSRSASPSASSPTPSVAPSAAGSRGQSSAEPTPSASVGTR